MPSPIFQIGATFDKTQLNAGFDSAVTDAKGWAARMDVTFEGASTSTKRWMGQISDDTKLAAASASADQIRSAEATKANIEAQRELAAATKLAKGPLGDTTEVVALLAAAQERARAASAALSEAQSVFTERTKAAATEIEKQRRAQEATTALQGNLGGPQSSVAYQRMAAATLESVIAQRALREIQDQVAVSTLNEAEKVEILAPALARAQVASLELAAAQKEITGASHGAVSGVQATSGAIRTLEGNAGIRAVENFISKTLGLGPAMQAIFPLIGGLAFGKILLDMGEKIVDVEQKAQHASTAIDEAFGDLHDKAQVTNADLALQNDKLQDEIDKLSGHPNNGLQTALDEARKMADQLLSSLRADRKELEALLKEHEVGAFGSLLSGVAPTHTEGKEVLADQQNLTNQVRDAQKKFEAEFTAASDDTGRQAATDRRNVAIRAAFRSQIDTYRQETERLSQEEKDSAAASRKSLETGDAPLKVVDNSAKLSIINGRAQQLQDALDHEKYIESIAQKEKTVGQLKQDKANAPKAGAENKEAEQRFKKMEADLNEEKLQYNLSVKAVFDFWAARRSAFEQGSEQYNQVTAKMAEQAVAGSRAAAEALKKVQAEQKKNTNGNGEAAVDKGMEDMSKAMQKQGENVIRSGQQWDEYFRAMEHGKEITAAIADEINIAQLRALEASGGITRLGAAQVEARMHAEQHRIALAALREELERLEKEATRDPVTGAVTDPKQAARIAGVQNQITQEKGKGQVQAGQDKVAVGAEIARPYLTAFNDINSGWLKVQRDLIQGNQGIKRSFAEMGLGLVQSMAAATEKMLADIARGEIKKMALHAATSKANATIDAAGAATSTQVSALSALKQMNHAASVAAGKAWSAMADIPIVGPELGAVAAAATYAGVMALASFDVGTAYVPHDGVAMIHEGETILPPPQAQVLRDALSGGGNGSDGGGDMHLHLGGNSFSSANGDFRSQLNTHERHLATMFQRMHREGKLDFKGN
ncbi:MAG: hypothetical protein M3O02_09920 [Acidobacteriota bacterium]|nr:hypothetical protein [Acidobacteriota bacterium]